MVNSIPNKKIVDWPKLKAFAEDKISPTEKKNVNCLLGIVENCRKRRKCLQLIQYSCVTCILELHVCQALTGLLNQKISDW